jgi:hypothetical protein
MPLLLSLLLFWWDCGLKAGLHTCKAALLLEPPVMEIRFHKVFAWAVLKP